MSVYARSLPCRNWEEETPRSRLSLRIVRKAARVQRGYVRLPGFLRSTPPTTSSLPQVVWPPAQRTANATLVARRSFAHLICHTITVFRCDCSWSPWTASLSSPLPGGRRCPAPRWPSDCAGEQPATTYSGLRPSQRQWLVASRHPCPFTSPQCRLPVLGRDTHACSRVAESLFYFLMSWTRLAHLQFPGWVGVVVTFKWARRKSCGSWSSCVCNTLTRVL